MEVPRPTLCPTCRSQRRTLQTNQYNLFKRKCDATGEEIITNFTPDSEYKVYSQEYWYGDEYDGTKFGRDFDFTRPFFEQFDELSKEAPRPALFTDFIRNQNSDYTNFAGKNKNCYLIFDSDENQDCLYCFGTNSSRSSIDQDRVQQMELSYECLDSKNCYNCAYLYDCENCSDSVLMKNCIGVKHSIFCSNLKNKEYHVFNELVSKERYQEIMKEFGSYKYLQHKIGEFNKFRLKFPQKYMRGFQNENCTGNYLVQCKNAIMCFDSLKVWDGKYCDRTFISGKDLMDCTEVGESQLIYESNVIAFSGYNIRFSNNCVNSCHDMDYCEFCSHCEKCFGCVGLKKKKFCIFNKRYTEEQYNDLKSKIIEHMRKTQEWGEFFPGSLSPHAYNLSLAMIYFPLNKEQILAESFKYHEPDQREYLKQTYVIPDHIKDVPDTIVDKILACEICGKNYKINDRELQFYKRQNMPIPKECYICRHLRRLRMKNPRVLYNRNCDKCHAEVKTTFAPDRPEIIYCEPCYQQSLS